MSPSLRVPTARIVILTLASFCVSSPAFAGFQWSPPVEQAAPEPIITSAPAAAAPSAAPEIISPVIITGPVTPAPASATVAPPSSVAMPAPVSTTSTAAPADSSGNELFYHGPSPDVRPGPMSPERVSNAPAVTPATSETVVPLVAPPSAPASAASDDTVRGFAKSVPVVVALRQILPTGYAFSIDQNVDMGTLVSFKGGRPWRETLADALAPVGLAAREDGQMVTVARAGDRKQEVASEVAKEKPSKTAKTAKTTKMVPPHKPATVATTVPLAAPVPASAPAPAMMMAPAPAAPAAPDAWTAERGDSLHRVLGEWCKRSHVEFDWLSEYDYPLEASVSFSGSFEDALRNLLAGFEGAHPQPVAELHNNSALGQMVLIVQTRGNTNTD